MRKWWICAVVVCVAYVEPAFSICIGCEFYRHWGHLANARRLWGRHARS
ncbi:DUF4395 family protein [Streptomyces sp. NPDC057705]